MDIKRYPNGRPAVTKISIEMGTQKMYKQVGNKLEPLSVSKGEIIHGIIWYQGKKSAHQACPMLLYHELEVADKVTLAGNARRVLIATCSECHEPGGVNILATIDELREDPNVIVSFVQTSEDMVLDVFHQLTFDNEGEKYGKRMLEPVTFIVPPIMQPRI